MKDKTAWVAVSMSKQSGDSGGVDLQGPVWLKDGILGRQELVKTQEARGNFK